MSVTTRMVGWGLQGNVFQLRKYPGEVFDVECYNLGLVPWSNEVSLANSRGICYCESGLHRPWLHSAWVLIECHLRPLHMSSNSISATHGILKNNEGIFQTHTEFTNFLSNYFCCLCRNVIAFPTKQKVTQSNFL